MIRVKCSSPRYAKGEHDFAKFEDFAKWLLGVESAKGAAGGFLYVLAKSGSSGTHKRGLDFEATTDFRSNYSAIVELAQKVGLLRTRNFGDSYSRDDAIAWEFAKRLDRVAGIEPKRVRDKIPTFPTYDQRITRQGGSRLLSVTKWLPQDWEWVRIGVTGHDAGEIRLCLKPLVRTGDDR